MKLYISSLQLLERKKTCFGYAERRFYSITIKRGLRRNKKKCNYTSWFTIIGTKKKLVLATPRGDFFGESIQLKRIYWNKDSPETIKSDKLDNDSTRLVFLSLSSQFFFFTSPRIQNKTRKKITTTKKK